MIPINLVLNLHQLYFEGESFVEEEIEEIVDNFMSPYLMSQGGEELRIITGKGIHSKHFINGKNPLRYYTEKYLDKIGFAWKYADERHGGCGAIVIQV
jgi:DNA-nicking Smr family endonuclease